MLTTSYRNYKGALTRSHIATMCQRWGKADLRRFKRQFENSFLLQCMATATSAIC